MTVKIGDRFHAIHADTYATWEVTEKRGRGTWIAVIPDDFDGGFNGASRAFTTQDIEDSMAQEAGRLASMDEHSQWYASQPIGTIVHLDDGHNKFTRCEVVAYDADKFAYGMGETPAHGKALKPVALVGAWAEYDLPRRRPDGEIDYGVYVRKIVDGSQFEPNYSNIYEARDNAARAQYYNRPQLDPRNLPAVDLTVPPMTADEEREADLVRLLQEVSSLLNGSDSNRTILNDVRALVQSDRAESHL